VEESARGAGLGRELIQAAFERARERGCRRMELDVNEANAGALRLYESLGFEAWSDPPGGRNLLMRRRL
jgi:ribosomal protein S18 acetylase RimI-like enzyme